MFSKKTVDSVLVVFTKALEDLDQIRESRYQEMRELEAKLVVASMECDRATTVAQKLRKLVA